MIETQLGYPPSYMSDWYLNKYYTLVFKGISGTEYKFKPDDQLINKNLQYCSFDNPYEPTEPYIDKIELQTKTNLLEVIDENKEISSIGSNSFYVCRSLSSVDCPNVISVGNRAFCGCSNLKSITLSNINVINPSTFNGCNSLSSVNCHNATSICSYAFYCCSSLIQTDFMNVSSIAEHAFSKCSNLKQIDLPNVSSIGNNAFSYCTSLSSVNCHNATSIGSYAFYCCSNLNSIYLPNLTCVKWCAFDNCTNISSINIQSATNIGRLAFQNCEKLSTIILSAVTVVPTAELYMFDGCPNLISVYVHDSDMVNAFQNSGFWSRYYQSGKVTFVPALDLDMITTDGTKCKFNTSDPQINKNISFSPNEGEVSEPYCLCSELSDTDSLLAVIDNNGQISSIGEGAFWCCTNLTSVQCDNITRLGNKAFSICNSLISVSFPSLKEADNYAFDSSNLQIVNISAISSLGEGAFDGCQNLSSIDFRDISSIGNGAFEGCNNLSTLSVSENNLNFSFVNNDSDLTSKNGIVMLDNNNHKVIWGSIPMCKNIVLPNDVSSIEGGAFDDCQNLTSIDCPNVSSIGGDAFNWCKNLSAIDCPNVSSIGDRAFYWCNNLKTIILSNIIDCENPTSIGNFQVFDQINETVSVYVHDNDMVEAFKTAKNWSTYHSQGKVTFIPVNIVEMTDTNGKILQFNTPINRNLKYTNANSTIYSPYNNCDSEISSNKNALVAVNDPNCSITSIDDDAFYNCSKLSSINCSAVTILNMHAFYGCVDLTSVNIPKIAKVCDYAFAGCSKISSFNIPNDIYIGWHAFDQCSNLSTIILSGNTRPPEINTNAFDGCPTPVSVYVYDTDTVTAYSKACNWRDYLANGQVTFIPVC